MYILALLCDPHDVGPDSGVYLSQSVSQSASQSVSHDEHFAAFGIAHHSQSNGGNFTWRISLHAC